ncbi:unnamed protein product [Protopolystoma xenopodis]|uniref:Uncharacterized protein n=1 Tax=Protopolystoma xenopodis TaxID=117903 RepID=A0A3S5B2L0_9PLAT|nr:unnamed protein product [Protopolystoma xenopodis]
MGRRRPLRYTGGFRGQCGRYDCIASSLAPSALSLALAAAILCLAHSPGGHAFFGGADFRGPAPLGMCIFSCSLLLLGLVFLASWTPQPPMPLPPKLGCPLSLFLSLPEEGTSRKRKAAAVSSHHPECMGCFNPPLPGKKFCSTCWKDFCSSAFPPSTRVTEVWEDSQENSPSRDAVWDTAEASSEEESQQERFSNSYIDSDEDSEGSSGSFDLSLVSPLIKAVKLTLGAEEDPEGTVSLKRSRTS